MSNRQRLSRRALLEYQRIAIYSIVFFIGGCISVKPIFVFAAPVIPGSPQARPIALVGGTIHPVSGPIITEGTLVFTKGKISFLGKDVIPPKDAEIIEVQGKHIYPALFDADSHLGLVEIDAVRATRDSRETGRFNPNARVEVAINPDSELIPVTRANGVLLTLTAPEGDLIAGTSAILQLDGWTHEELTLQAPVGLHLDWPRMVTINAWWEESSAKKQLEERDTRLLDLHEFFENARAYQVAHKAAKDSGEPLSRDTRWEAMLPVLEGKIPVIIHADEIHQIQAAVAFAQQHSLRMILLGGYDAPACAELLLKYKIPVIVAAVQRLPMRRGDDYDSAYTLPARLKEAGIPYCIAGTGRFVASNVRNLPYHAATAVAYGLDPDEGLRAITLYPAQILGVERQVGSLEAGKDATLIVTDGDPLETATHVEKAFVQGRRVDLDNRHEQLWRKYKEKYNQQKK